MSVPLLIFFIPFTTSSLNAVHSYIDGLELESAVLPSTGTEYIN